jgi:FMN phosphatase YigB (HAD superfamily)
MLRAVLFDYGNVLVGWDPRRLYARLIPDAARCDWFLEEVCPLSWHLLHDQGVPMAETVPARIAAFPDWADEIRAWDWGFAEMISGEIAGSVQALKALFAAGTPCFCLTNMPSEKVDTCFGPFAFPRLFTDVIVSGDEKCAKPDAAVFHLALRRMGGLAPEEVFFTDDSPKNIEAAAALGFQTQLFRYPQGLWQALRSAGAPI